MIYAILMLGALQALTFPSINALLSRLAGPSHQGALMGGMQSLSSIAWIVSPFVLSQALAFGADRGFTGGNFAVAATLVFIALAIVLLRVVPRVSREPAPVAEA
jgi:DHA1 family tetracycline resistance protein-like MFS transporter